MLRVLERSVSIIHTAYHQFSCSKHRAIFSSKVKGIPPYKDGETVMVYTVTENLVSPLPVKTICTRESMNYIGSLLSGQLSGELTGVPTQQAGL